MKSLKQVIADNSDYKTLINAVINRLGIDNVENVNGHGISGGYPGFTWYSDTVRFFNRHKKDILRMAEDMADQLGEDMLSMIQNFNCLSSGRYPNKKPHYTQTEIAQAIFSGKGDSVQQIKNALAWFAAEEVCRMFEE